MAKLGASIRSTARHHALIESRSGQKTSINSVSMA